MLCCEIDAGPNALGNGSSVRRTRAKFEMNFAILIAGVSVSVHRNDGDRNSLVRSHTIKFHSIARSGFSALNLM